MQRMNKMHTMRQHVALGMCARDIKRAFGIALLTVVVYSGIFAWFAYSAVQNGVSIERTMMAVDSADYVGIAKTMLSSHRFAMTPEAPPAFFRTPGYPAFVAVILAATHSVVAVGFIQILLTALAGALIYLIGARIFTRAIGLVAALLYVFDPLVIVHTWLILTESLFVALILGATLLLMDYAIGAQRVRHILLAGIFLGAAVLTRPLGLYVLPFMALLMYRPSQGIRTALRDTFVFTCAIVVVLLPWYLRNAQLTGQFSLTSLSAYNVLYYNIAYFEADKKGISVDAEREILSQEVGARSIEEWQSLEFHDREAAVVKEHMHAYPVAYGIFHLVKSAPFFIGLSFSSARLILHNEEMFPGKLPEHADTTALVFHRQWKAAFATLVHDPLDSIERLFWAMAWVCSMLAAVLYVRTWNRHVFWVVGAFFFTIALGMLAGPIASPRYRIPAEPFLFLLALEGCRQAWRHRNRAAPFVSR